MKVSDTVTSTVNSLPFSAGCLLPPRSNGRDVKYKQEVISPAGATVKFDQEGANGELLARCEMNRPWLEAGDPNLAETFACAAELGTGGPGAEMPLLALDWALTRRLEDGSNAGFFRDDALWAIVIMTDQDDCSREDDGFILPPGAKTCFDPNDGRIIGLDHPRSLPGHARHA